MIGQWQFEITTGLITRPDGLVVALGYSGHGTGLDNPADESIPDIGPLPEGEYTIGELEAQHGRLGPNVRSLTSLAGTEMYGRSGFYIHGDNIAHDQSASEGCLVPDSLDAQPTPPAYYLTLAALRADMEGTLLVTK